jgi:hypothetical protein
VHRRPQLALEHRNQHPTPLARAWGRARNTIRVVPQRLRRHEVDAMLGEVGRAFGRVELEPQRNIIEKV